MIAAFGRRYIFSASHRLDAPALDADQNRAAYGKCNNAHGHGHNYFLQVMVAGPVNEETGMVVDMAALDETVRRLVLDRFDQANLNFDPLFADCVPTTENLCREIFSLLQNALPAGVLDQLRVEETENNFFECLREVD
jgi:6-pyruvoyltetrahydropterin/6-carboxytetrahydropterin synthase